MDVGHLLRSLVKRTSAAMTLTQNEIKRMGTEKTLSAIVERATAALTLRPAIGQGTDTTSVRLCSGTTCEVKEDGWQMVADLDPELGGSHDHPGPGFLLRAAMGTCFAQTAVLWAAKLDVPIDHLDVEVEAYHDARGLLGVDGADPKFSKLRYHIVIESPASEEDVHRVYEAARAHSPVQNCLEHTDRIEHHVQILDPRNC